MGGFLIEAFKRLSTHYVGIWSPRIGSSGFALEFTV